MCFDPVSMALMIGGTGMSMAGSGMDAKSQSKFNVANINADIEQLLQDEQEAKVRNEVLDRYRTTNEGFINENQGTLGDVIAGFQPGAQTQRMDDAVADRSGKITGAVNSAMPSKIAVRAGAPDIVQKTYDQKIGDVFSNAIASGERRAKVGSYGDAFASNERDTGQGQQEIGTVNQISRGFMSNLPAEQDLAGFQVKKPIFRPAAPEKSPWSDVLKFGGTLLGAAGGSGKFAGPGWGQIGDVFAAYAQPNPWMGR
jgi:hypothetical protein